MKKKEIVGLMPGEALRRIKSAQKVIVVGSTLAGKSTLIYALVNHCIIRYIMVGIGDRCQTTVIPCNFLFDERIAQDRYFCIRVNGKRFEAKLIHVKVLGGLAKLFAVHGCNVADTVHSIDGAFVNSIFEPSDLAYHLGKISNEISLDKFKRAVLKVLSAIAESEDDFNSRVMARKKELGKTKVSIDEIRGTVMGEMWDEIPTELSEDYTGWLSSIEEIIKNRLTSLLNVNKVTDKILEYSTENGDRFTFGGNVLRGLFDPSEPYSLVIRDLTLACSPREELVKMADRNVPLHFCLRDSVGLNQNDVDGNLIKDALDTALCCNPDSILLLIGLEERGSVISECCEVIGRRIDRVKRLGVPVNVIFTKPDIVIGNIINKERRDTIELTQKDYDKHIEDAISSVDRMVKGFAEKMSVGSVGWFSVRYLEEDIDPIQKALKTKSSDQIDKFRKTGLYSKVNCIIRNAQTHVLPKGMAEPFHVTVQRPDCPVIEFKIDGGAVTSVLNNVKNALTQDKSIVNGYIIKDKKRISGRSVVRYYDNLCKGLGYYTKSYVHGNFSINMKGVLNRVLLNNIPDLASLYEAGAIKMLADNMAWCGIDRLLEVFDESYGMTESVSAVMSSVIFAGLSPKARKLQKLHFMFRDYFNSPERYYMVMDRAAYNLSYGNCDIKALVDGIYFDDSLTYDETIRKIQIKFYDMFASQKFADMVAEEIGNAMTGLVNKMFVII